jgi:branched-chain amino acid transport system permease protein
VARAARVSPPRSTDWKRYATWAIYLIVAVAITWWLADALEGRRPARLLQTTLNGLLAGGIYSLIAVGIVIINKASGVFNFAHGAMMLFGAMIFYSVFTVESISLLAAAPLALVTVAAFLTTNGWREALNGRSLAFGAGAALLLTVGMTAGGPDLRLMRAIVGGVTGAVLLGLVIERLTIRPLIGQPLFTIVLMTLALDRILVGMNLMIWGSVDRPLTIFAGLDRVGIPQIIRIDATETFLDGRINIASAQLIAFVLALVAFIAFVLFFRFTSAGLSMRATAEDQKLAQSVGLRVRAILALAWGIAALLAMIAGVLQGGATNLGQGMPTLALRAFPAVLLGGLESIGGALVGGIVIGLVQEWANLLFPGTEAGTELAPYVILMIVLIIRPDGLFGQKRIERI